MDKIQVLQLGYESWEKTYSLPDTVELSYVENLTKPPKRLYDLVFLDRMPLDCEIVPLRQATRAYTLFVTERVELTGRMDWLYRSKRGRRITSADIPDFLRSEAKRFFPDSYGEKTNLKDLAVAQGFSGSVRWNGNCSVSLEGDFGTEFNQVVFWKYNIPISHGQCLDLWVEYQKSERVSIVLTVTLFTWASDFTVQKKWEFSEKDLEREVRIDNEMSNGLLFLSLMAAGEGELRIIALHDRFSRGKYGLFIPGGEQHVTSNREEVFSYFDPGDMKPPLTVYFSGYKTQEGFEGYYLMRNMGCPFLLIAEARLEGGGFYVGTQEYETVIVDLILKSMKELGFTRDQVILSGISMGSFGALYYGCDIMPHATILGKPLASIGDVAANERLRRPGGFPTSLDVLQYLCGSMDEDAVKRLNHRLWDKFDRTDWGQSKIIVSYMIEDDYDSSAYEKLISHLHSDGVQLYGKGFHGRHNDNTLGIVNWFSGQMRQILSEDFQRKAEG